MMGHLGFFLFQLASPACCAQQTWMAVLGTLLRRRNIVALSNARHTTTLLLMSLFFFIKSFALPKAGGLEKKKKKKPELLPNRRPSSALLLTFALICCRILASPWARVPTTSLSSSRFSVQDYECHKQKKRTTYYHAHAQSRGGEPQSWLSWRQARLRVCQNVTTWPRL